MTPRPPSAEALNAYLRQQGSPLAGQGAAFASIGRKYGVDPRYLVALSGAESSFGKNNFRQKNAWGYGQYDFPTWAAGIDKVAAGIAMKGPESHYFGQGRYSVDDIASIYAPVGASNDPNQTNSFEPKNVTTFLRAMGGNPADVRYPLGGPAPDAPSPSPVPAVTKPVVGPPTASSPSGPPSPAGLDLSAALNPIYQMIGLPAMPSITPPAPTAASAPKKAKPIAQLPHPDGGTIPVVADVRKPGKGALDAIRLAKEYLGTPYSWGGGGPDGPSYGFAQGANIKGFDCSSLLQYVWGKEGIKIPRVTYDQFKTGRPVAKGKLQPGDAVFFHMGAQGPEHVGMYTGNDQFIHAPSTGDVVKISKFSTYGGFAGARRFI